MPGKQAYEYSLIRVIPRIERGECINVGVLLFCKRPAFLKMRYDLPQKRLLALWPELDLELLQRYLENWKLICAGDLAGGPIARLEAPERFRWLTAAKSTVLQCSFVHPGLSQDLDQTLEELFEQFVLLEEKET